MPERLPRLLVAGAGPAGIAAALEGHRRGMDVTLVDEGAEPGGQYYMTRRSDGSSTSPHALRAAGAGIRIDTRTVICDAPTAFRLTTWSKDSGLRDRAYEALVIATGAYERSVPVPGWTLPGVLAAGGAHTLARLNGVRIGQRVIVAGSGPFLLAAAAAIRATGAQVTLIEATSSATSLSGLRWLLRDPTVLFQAGRYLGRLAFSRTRFLYGHAVTAIHGSEHVEGVTVQRVDREWRPVAGSERRLEADAVCLGFGFIPQVDLALLVGCTLRYRAEASAHEVVTDHEMRTSLPGVYAAGEVSGIGGHRVAALEGRLAGLAAAHDAGLVPGSEFVRSAGSIRRRLQGPLRVARWIDTAFAPRAGIWGIAGQTEIVCRCEDVSFAMVQESLEVTAATPAAVKVATRAGMGPCQGKVCGPVLREWLRATRGYVPPPDEGPWSVRPPIRAVPLAAWAGSGSVDPS